MNRRNTLAAITMATLATAAANVTRADDSLPPPQSSPSSAAIIAPNTAPQDVSSEIRALREKLEALEAKQAQAQREQELRQTKDDVAVDADRRSTLMIDTGGFTGGFEDDRFVIRSADGNYSFRPWMHLQFRNVTLVRQDNKTQGTDDYDNGFEVRRLKLGFDGNLFSPDFTYFFNWATNRGPSNQNVVDSTGAKIGTVNNGAGGALILEEAWFKYHFNNSPWYVKAGQLKDPLLHEQIVSSRYQQSAERSLSSDIFANGDAFTHGVTAIYDPKSWMRAEFGITDGMRSANTNFQDYPKGVGNAYDYGFAARMEFKTMGRWQDYGQIGAVNNKEPLLVFGVGADYSERGSSSQTVGVADVMYAQPTGFNLYASIIDRYTTENLGFPGQTLSGASFGTPGANVAGKSTNEYSFLIQAGYLIDKKWEPFARYEYIHVAGTPAGSQNYIHDITGGLNYYFVGHRAKLTLEVQYLPNGLPFDDSASSVLTNNANGEFSGVVQFQLLL